jgi:hypothetical protein
MFKNGAKHLKNYKPETDSIASLRTISVSKEKYMGMDNGSTYVSLYVIFIVHFINVKLF